MGVGQSCFKQKESVRPHSITFFEQKRQLKKGSFQRQVNLSSTGEEYF